MTTLHIEWKHLDKDGRTCDRCAETGATLRRVIQDLTEELAARDIRVTFTETRLSEREIPQSNIILFNGVPLEELVPGVHVIDNHCESCSDLCDKNTSCRTLRVGATVSEAIPAFLIREAAWQALGLRTPLPVRHEPAKACCACCE